MLSLSASAGLTPNSLLEPNYGSDSIVFVLLIIQFLVFSDRALHVSNGLYSPISTVLWSNGCSHFDPLFLWNSFPSLCLRLYNISYCFERSIIVNHSFILIILFAVFLHTYGEFTSHARWDNFLVILLMVVFHTNNCHFLKF